MRILAFANQKGGVGKTTTTFNVAVALASEGQRVLAVDMDPQAHLTLMSGVDLSRLQHSIYDCLLYDRPVGQVIVESRHGYSVAPSDLMLARAEAQLPGQFEQERRLRTALDGVSSAYDYCLIDCPPSIGVLTQNALVAADGLVIPVQPELYAIQGIKQLFETIAEVRQDNPHLAVTAVVPTLKRRNRHHDEMIAMISNLYPDLPIADGIPEAVAFGRAARAGKAIFEFAPASSGARAYERLTEKILASA